MWAVQRETIYMAWHMACGMWGIHISIPYRYGGCAIGGVWMWYVRCSRWKAGFKLINLPASGRLNSECILSASLSGGSDVICKFNLSSSNGIYPIGGRGRSALLRFYYQFLWFMHSLLFVPAQEPPDPRFPFPMHRPPVLCLSRIADCQLAATLWLRHAHKKVIKFLFTLVIGSEKH